MSSDIARKAIDIGLRIHPLLAGHPPELQGAILADLLAMWLAGYPPQMREEILAQHIAGMRPLIEVNDKIMFGADGHPSAK